MARYVQLKDGFDPGKTCGLCGGPLNRRGDAALSTDANLISAAPELLEALKTLVAMNNCNYERGITDYQNAMSAARASIAKATA